MKTCSASLVTRERQMKITVGCHSALARMAVPGRTEDTAHRQGSGVLVDRWWGQKWAQPLWKTAWVYLGMLVPLPGICHTEMSVVCPKVTYKNVVATVFIIGPPLETAHLSVADGTPCSPDAQRSVTQRAKTRLMGTCHRRPRG